MNSFEFAIARILARSAIESLFAGVAGARRVGIDSARVAVDRGIPTSAAASRVVSCAPRSWS